MAETVKKKTTSRKTNSTNTDKKLHLDWFKLMYRIRRFEERSLLAYSQQKIRGFLHVYIGQEAIAAGLSTAIKPTDSIVTAYRQHGIGITRGLTTAGCMAELFGKSGGVNKGKGGSMHFFSKALNYFGGNGIVGAQIPIGTGIALAEKYRETKNLCVTMFGDGAARQGALYESFNMAMTWQLPVLYIVENNGYAMGTSIQRTSNVTELYKIGAAFEMPSEAVDGMDPVAVHKALLKAAKHIRAGKGPYFLEMRTYRYRGHSVSDPAKYRSKDELKEYMDVDPIKVVADKIIKNKWLTAKALEKVRDEVEAEIEAAVTFADESPLPDPSELYTDNYMQEDYPFMRD